MLYIRTDMNALMATGHIMRCLSIADAVKEQGENVTFLIADTSAVSLLQERNYSYMVLDTQWDHMEIELPILEELIRNKKVDKLLIDSYQVTENYLRRLTALTETYYIDDLGSFAYPVNAVICYAIYWKKFYREVESKTKIYGGTNYMPLRKEFCNCDRKSISKQVENLLLLSGGTDQYNILVQLLEKLDINCYQQVEVICGAYDLNYDYLCQRYQNESRIMIRKAVVDMKECMCRADLAISAGGTTLYELCACGTPTISYSFVDNQLDNVMQFQENGIIDYAGDARNADIGTNVVRLLEKYHKDDVLRQQRSEKMQQLVDGKGAERIAKLIFH